MKTQVAPKRQLLFFAHLPALALRDTGRYGGGGSDGDCGLEGVGAYKATIFDVGVEARPMRSRDGRKIHTAGR